MFGARVAGPDRWRNGLPAHHDGSAMTDGDELSRPCGGSASWRAGSAPRVSTPRCCTGWCRCPRAATPPRGGDERGAGAAAAGGGWRHVDPRAQRADPDHHVGAGDPALRHPVVRARPGQALGAPFVDVDLRVRGERAGPGRERIVGGRRQTSPVSTRVGPTSAPPQAASRARTWDMRARWQAARGHRHDSPRACP